MTDGASEESILVGFGLAILDLKLLGMAMTGPRESTHKWGHGDGYEGEMDLGENNKASFNTALL